MTIGWLNPLFFFWWFTWIFIRFVKQFFKKLLKICWMTIPLSSFCPQGTIFRIFWPDVLWMNFEIPHKTGNRTNQNRYNQNRTNQNRTNRGPPVFLFYRCWRSPCRSRGTKTGSQIKKSTGSLQKWSSIYPKSVSRL